MLSLLTILDISANFNALSFCEAKDIFGCDT